jgi:hypothetical protein
MSLFFSGKKKENILQENILQEEENYGIRKSIDRFSRASHIYTMPRLIIK